MPAAWHGYGDEADTVAAALVAKLTNDEKVRLIQGVGWSGWTLAPGFYVGSAFAVPRLGIPSQNMQDAAQGFRTSERRTVGQVTSWPCALAVASTWDRALTREWAAAIAREFKTKGANVIPVDQRPRSLAGRNAEYFGGEDPHLGVAVAPEYVAGVQGEGVAGVAKHYALNNQETRRDTISDDASERALWEIYYPPFEASVAAGVASIMCGYNRVNGTHACGSRKLLVDDLKGKMGFDGWVMSDWWAVHATDAAANGVDQLMPGNLNYFDEAPLYRTVGAARVDEMATRVLRGLIGAGAFAPPAACVVGCDCFPLIADAVATSPAHVALARRIGANATVLLKNDGAVLPLRGGPATTVALVGACDSTHDVDAAFADWTHGDYYVVGGSGRVLSYDAVSLAAALRARGGAPAVRVAADESLEAALARRRRRRCHRVRRCDDDRVARPREPAPRPARPPCRPRRRRAAGAADCRLAGARRRRSALGSERERGGQPFLGGQETGNAVADVLLGDVNPSARLPVTFPLSEVGTTAPCDAERCVYDEGVHIGWRALQGRPVAFEFGAGPRTPPSPTRGRRRPLLGADGVVRMAVAVTPPATSPAPTCLSSTSASPPRRASRRSSSADSPRRGCWRRAPTRPSSSPSPRATSRRTTEGAGANPSASSAPSSARRRATTGWRRASRFECTAVLSVALSTVRMMLPCWPLA